MNESESKIIFIEVFLRKRVRNIWNFYLEFVLGL